MKKLSTREWILITSLLMLVEYLISSNSYIFRDDQTLLNYISFASTIASILLAVIAIIFSFIQSDSGAKANNKLVDRLDEFKSIYNKILRNSNKSDDQLERLSSITDILNELKISMENSSDKLVSIENKTLKIHEVHKNVKDEITRLNNQKELSNNITHDKSSHNENIARLVLRKSTTHADIITYALNKVAETNEKITLFDFVEKYLTPLSDDVNTNETTFLNKLVLHWITFTILHILNSANLIYFSENDKYIVIKEELSENLATFSKEIKLLELDLMKKAVKHIDSL